MDFRAVHTAEMCMCVCVVILVCAFNSFNPGFLQLEV